DLSDGWLWAAQTTQYVAGCVPCVQLRNALPLPQDAGRERMVDRGSGAHHRARPRRSAHGPSRQDRLPVDGGGEGALRTAPLPDGARRVRGRDLRRALRLLRPDVPRRAHARARGPPQSAGGAPGEDARLPGADQRAPRRLHPRAPAPRDGVRGARSALAERAHRERACRAGPQGFRLRGDRSARHHIWSDGRPAPAGGRPPAGYARRHRHVSPSQGLTRTTQGATGMGSVRVAIVGVGNCAASLVQGVEYYKDSDPASKVPGLMPVQFGDYHVRDVEFVAAFDVDAKKVGLDLADAIGASENNTIKICDVPSTGVTVQRGHTHDGPGKYYRETTEAPAEQPADAVQARKDPPADVLVCYLPVGSEDAAKFYAQCAIDAKVAFVNALPVFIAGTKEWADKFTEAGVPIVGDDIKSQVGATITHRVMAKLFED